MKTYPKRAKPNRESGHYFYGDFGEIPTGFSFVEINEPQEKFDDRNHYHKEGTEYFFVVKGKGILDVEGHEVELNHENLVEVEPGEKHFVKKITEAPFSFFVMCTVKDNDKIFVE